MDLIYLDILLFFLSLYAFFKHDRHMRKRRLTIGKRGH
ncbi:Hypothetical protein SmN45_0290 [Serratia marcescens]|nr:Hypothetical protein SmN45_0290 [Serratia marcescens]